MRQVPHTEQAFLIIGNGKLARHLIQYFKMLNIPLLHWHRKQNKNILLKHAKQADRILLCISDKSIENFYQEERQHFQDKICIHFSGSQQVDGVFAVHPLMSFSESLFELETYKKIAFNTFQKKFDLEDLLPGLSNPSFYIPKEIHKSYHAHCAVIGNLPQILWAESGSFWENIGMDFNYLESFVMQSFKNIAEKKHLGITGPISRNDDISINSNIASLNNPKLSKLYTLFHELYKQEDFLHEKH